MHQNEHGIGEESNQCLKSAKKKKMKKSEGIESGEKKIGVNK